MRCSGLRQMDKRQIHRKEGLAGGANGFKNMFW